MKYSNNKLARYSIRKYSIGVASVLIGFFFMGASASADQMTEASIVAPSSLVTENSDATVASTNTEIGKSTEVVQVNTPEVSLGSPNETGDEAKPDTIKKSELSISESDTSNKVSEESTTPVLETKDEKETPKVVAEDKQADTLEQVDPTNPEGKKTVGYAAANIDKPKTSVVNDVTRIRATKKDGKYIHSTDVDNVSSGDVVLFSAGGGSIARGDDYPQRFKNGRIWVDADDWGQYVRECTSFVAYRLSTVNGFTIPYAYGDANLWGYRAQNEGYRVDMNPAAGSVAWFTGNKGFHVAWVVGVNGENVEIEEYNYGYTNRYNHRFIPRNSASGYIHFKDLKGGNTSIPDAPTPTNNTGSSLASSGAYQFTERVSIKAEPKMSAPELAYYEAGNTVNYDKTLQADGYVWISYLSYAGNRRYIPVQKLSTEVKPEVKGTINVTNKNDQSGTFDVVISNVSSNVGLKEVQVPIWSAKNGQDDLKWYKAVKQSDGTYKTSVKISDHKNDRGEYLIHLYYVIDSGKQIGVGGTTTTVESASTTSNPSKPSIPNSGIYTFKGHASIKAEPKISAPELAYYDAGNTVNYDSLIQADGHYWISYLSYSGARRYIAIS